MNYTTKNITLILIGFILFQNVLSQDTLFLDSKSEYFSDSDTIGIFKYYGKNVYYRANYSKELIQFNKDSAKLEYCFYYDKKRFLLYNQTYIFEIIKDSILKVIFNDYSEIWRFDYETDSLYKLTHNFNNLKEIGFAKSLIPLEKIGDFYVTDPQGDTLWTTRYSKVVFPDLIIKEKPLNDSVYVICDIMPTYPGGLDKMRQDLLRNLRVDMPIIESSPNCSRLILSFVIDKQGDMRDIRFIRSCGNGFLERSILIALNSLDKFTNGFMDNEPVNIRFTMPIQIDLQ
jgi:protein TonB